MESDTLGGFLPDARQAFEFVDEASEGFREIGHGLKQVHRLDHGRSGTVSLIQDKVGIRLRIWASLCHITVSKAWGDC
jgi:hypothetical protein